MINEIYKLLKQHSCNTKLCLVNFRMPRLMVFMTFPRSCKFGQAAIFAKLSQ